jgi:hypothetical protein
MPTGRSSSHFPAGAAFGPDELSASEVKQLWWLLDGAIMAPDVRQALRRSWGLCPRHAWAHALVEVERRGGVPMSVALLQADLLSRAATATAGRRQLPFGHHRPRLEGDGRCMTCEYLQLAHDPGPSWAQDARRVNERPRFAALAAEARPLIQTHACPQCLGGDGLVCRPHLLAGVQPSPDLAAALVQLAGRVRAYVRSTTVDGAPVDALGRFSWIEALGWSAGWDLPSRPPDRTAA